MIYKIIVDKQASSNPSNEKREYTVDIEELRVKGSIYDSLVITKDEAFVIRRLSLNECHVLSVLDEPEKEVLKDLNIMLFEGDNYIYLADMSGNKFYAEYLIKNDFTDIYVTKNEMNSSITQSATQIELSVNQKLEGYSTTQEMNSAITQSAQQIQSSVNNTLKNYSTTTQMNSVITQKADEITSSVSSTYATKTQLNTAKSEIKQTTDSISTEVSKKVGNNEVISKINQSAESVGINADKIQLSANDILNLLAGNTINLTSKNIVISADKFSVDKNGKVSASDINITGGKVKVSGTSSATDLLRVNNSNNSSEFSYVQAVGAGFVGSSGRVDITAQGSNSTVSNIAVIDTQGATNIYGSYIKTPTLTQTSKESLKKNIEKYNENAMEIVKNSEIYTYNFKTENDDDKKHIGFVISDLGGSYKTPKQVISADEEGILNYDMTSILWKAVQEVITKMEKLEGGQVIEEN